MDGWCREVDYRMALHYEHYETIEISLDNLVLGFKKRTRNQAIGGFKSWHCLLDEQSSSKAILKGTLFPPKDRLKWLTQKK